MLTDTVYNYIEDVALTIKSDTEHSGRTDANLVDALHGLLQYGITSDDIVAYLAEKKDSAPSFHERKPVCMIKSDSDGTPDREYVAGRGRRWAAEVPQIDHHLEA